MSFSSLTLLGLAAALFTTASNVPQVYKAWVSGETKDLSLPMTVMLALGLSLWVAYGAAQKDPVIVIANSLALCLALSLMALKIRNG